MVSALDARGTVGKALQGALTGRESYHLDVPAAPDAEALSVVSFEATERLGEPYRVKVRVTHPLELARENYLRKPATFRMTPADGAVPRLFSGWISRFSRTKTTGDFCAYEMEVRPNVALLELTTASRIYQQKTAPQIIESILRRHGLEGHQFAFRTRREYPERKFRLQYQMSDWDFVRLLMEQEGLYSYFVPSQFGTHLGDVFTVADDIDHYIYQPALHVPYREAAGMESGVESVFSLQTHARTVPASFLAADYNPAHAYERPRDDANVAFHDKGNYGQPYVFGTHHLDWQGAKWEAQLRHEAALAGQIVYEGESNVLELCPARILRMDAALPDAPHGQVVTEVIHKGARDQAYRNTYKAIPSGRRYRLPIDERKWPRIAGTLSGRITAPDQYKYAYLTRDGHYVVRFDFDFDAWRKGGESVPLRLAKPFAGGLQTGFHFPLLEGTEVAVAFHDGNPNRPYIAHALHNSVQPDLITHEGRWPSRNVIRTQRNNKLRMEDWEGHEGIKLSTEYGGKSQLNLGYLVDADSKQRGDGFELRTSAWGAIRAGKGVLISADDQPAAGGQQLEMERVRGLLQQALQASESLAEAARTAQAEAADCARQRALLDGYARSTQTRGAAGHRARWHGPGLGCRSSAVGQREPDRDGGEPCRCECAQAIYGSGWRARLRVCPAAGHQAVCRPGQGGDPGAARRNAIDGGPERHRHQRQRSGRDRGQGRVAAQVRGLVSTHVSDWHRRRYARGAHDPIQWHGLARARDVGAVDERDGRDGLQRRVRPS